MTIPRWAAIALGPLVFLVAIPLAHGVLPWAISLLGHRSGWAQGQPGPWNAAGLVVVVLAGVLLLWVLVNGLAHAGDLPERIELNWHPKLLMTRGPYGISRHPMYVAEVALWLGWAVFYGSVPVGVGLLVVLLVVSLLAGWEERALERKFGEAYRRYAARVHRWLGRASSASKSG